VGASPDANVIGLDPLPGKSNYFIGNNSRNWQTEVPHYRQVRYENIYPGIDLIFYGNRQHLEFDFVVFPGADPKAIQIAFEGTEHPSIDSSGVVILRIRSDEIRLRTPVVYQIEDGLKKRVYGHYEITGTNRLSFAVSGYNPHAALVIDPVLDYSTYLGGRKADHANSIAVDTVGNVYIAGRTSSLDFPTTLGSFQPIAERKDRQEVFVTKLDPTGSLVYSTYLGGSSEEWASGIAVDSDGSAYVTGTTSSKDFPITFGAMQTVLRGSEDIFVTKLNSAGTALVYSTYIGGTCTKKYLGTDSSGGIAIDSTGNAYIAGSSSCDDFPTTFEAFQIAYTGGASDVVVAKLDPLGTGLLYSTYLGGRKDDRGNAIALDTDRNVYITGSTDSPDFPVTSGVIQPAHPGGNDAFVTKINASGSALAYSTYLGGRKEKASISGISGWDQGEAIAVDTAGHAYVTGWTDSLDFPITAGSFQTDYGGGGSDGFLTKLSTDGTSLIFSTYFGGRSVRGDDARAIAVDNAGNAYVAGETSASNFPTTANAFQPSYGKGSDGFVVKFSPEGAAIYSSYLGGRRNDQISGIAVDPAGNVYVTGDTSSKDFPTRNALQPVISRSSDAFVAKIVQ
jgi:hypothetical protein